MNAPAYRTVWALGSSRSNRHGARVTNSFWHTQQGDGSAESLAGYLNNSANGVSYHDVVRDGTVVHVVDDDYASWSVLNANPYSHNLCFAGSFAEWSREQWLRREGDIRIAVWLSLEVAKRKGFAARIIAAPYVRGEGIADHNYVTRILGIGNHTDVGPNFPWDRAKQFLAEFLGQVAPPKPVVNMINDEAGRNTWLGKRITPGENVTPDKAGRWAQFAEGYVYWHPSHGAYAIPKPVFETWATLGWEAGRLGYPVGKHTRLREGWVQAFQRGVIYRKDGQPGFEVHGLIGERWFRSGFEDGPYGWPTGFEIGQPDGTGTFQDFENGRIYWAPKQTVGLLDADGRDLYVPDKEKK
jgi:hypothetical protein